MVLIHNLCFAFFWRLFDHGLRFGLGDLELGECFLALRIKLSTRRRVLPLLLPHGWLMLQRALLVKHLLVLIDELTFHVVVVVLIVRVLLSIHFFLALRHDLDVRRVHLHVGWAIVENGRRHNRHRRDSRTCIVAGRHSHLEAVRSARRCYHRTRRGEHWWPLPCAAVVAALDRKSTRLNSSHT